MSQREFEVPHEEEVRRALARLVSSGLESTWLPEVQALLRLPAVRERTEAGEPDSGALRAVLQEGIESLGQSQYRNLLEIVLGLTPETEEMSAGDRRALAGKRFREGKRPVTAGTIRQHHEPRALDELAGRLANDPERDLRPDRTLRSRIEWHPAVRAAWAHEHHHLWRLSLSDYDPSTAVPRLQGAMERQGVRAWSVHEMLGVFDLLVEAWLPAAVTETTFEQELERTFKENLILRDSFSTSEVVAHWAWGEPEKRQMRVPPAEALATPPTPRQMARIVGGGDRKLLRRYQELDVVRWIAGEKGICFLLLVSMQRALPLLSLEARAVVKELMLRHGGRLGEAGVAGSSLLRGFGFADYVLQGRIEPHSFPELREVMRPLQEDLRAIGMRTHTFVLSTEVELAGETGLSGGLEGEERTSVKDLLQQGESERFQVRLTAMTDLLPDRGLGASGSSSQATELLMKTITGMLNGESGNIVIGVLPRDRGLGDPRLTGRLEDAPALGRYLLLGVDAEIPKGTDSLLQKVRQACNSFIEPDPAPYLQLRTEVIEGKTLLVVSVERPSGEWFYYMSGPGRAEFIVQTKTGRRALLGPEGDAYKAAHPRAG